MYVYTHTEQGSRIIKFYKMGEHFFSNYFGLVVCRSHGWPSVDVFGAPLCVCVCVVFSRVYTWAAEAELDESGGKTGTNITNC